MASQSTLEIIKDINFPLTSIAYLVKLLVIFKALKNPNRQTDRKHMDFIIFVILKIFLQ